MSLRPYRPLSLFIGGIFPHSGSKRLGLLASLLVLTACAEDPPVPSEDAGTLGSTSEQALVNGERETGFPAVGAMVIDMPRAWGQFCTGTLISPDWVLTASHCFLESEPDIPVENTSFCFGDDATDPSRCTRTVEFAELFTHPDYDRDTATADIALVRLESPVTDIDPMPLRTDPFSRANLGEEVLWIGFGLNDGVADTGNGLKRRGNGIIAEFFGGKYVADGDPAVPCNGDSGGPAFQTINSRDTVVGIMTQTSDEECSSFGIDTRVDIYIDWIEEVTGEDFASECDPAGGMCEAGSACWPVSGGRFACVASDDLPVAELCNADGSTWTSLPCADGGACLRTSATDPAIGFCFELCIDDDDCAMPNSCIVPVFRDIDDVGYCNCVDEDGDTVCAREDCDDSDADVRPGVEEVCFDDVDDNCDGSLTDGCPICTDTDGDGYCAEIDDCNDRSRLVNPGAEERCGNRADDNCDGEIDEGCVVCTDRDGDGFCEEDDDCDDTDADINPDADEVCFDDVDNNCADGVDEGCVVCTDRDRDGYCAEEDDCNDREREVNPGEIEVCEDGIDNNCDGEIDEECSVCTDDDDDGFCAEDDDCSDSDPSVNPRADEVCADGIDNNCDGEIDEGCAICTDADADGFCAEDGDCDDSDDLINPDGVEVCFNEVDEDCSGTLDDSPLCDMIGDGSDADAGADAGSSDAGTDMDSGSDDGGSDATESDATVDSSTGTDVTQEDAADDDAAPEPDTADEDAGGEDAGGEDAREEDAGAIEPQPDAGSDAGGSGEEIDSGTSTSDGASGTGSGGGCSAAPSRPAPYSLLVFAISVLGLSRRRR